MLLPLLRRCPGPVPVASARVIVVDDGSSAIPELAFDVRHGAIRSVQVIALARNVGHQRALAVGLAWCHDHLPGNDVLVMDSDGEDDPDAASRLISACIAGGRSRVVFAERTQRSEGWLFRMSYVVYRLLFRASTGTVIRYGNFSVVPHTLLGRLVHVSEIWSSYPAGILRARLPFGSVPTARASRLHGTPRNELREPRAPRIPCLVGVRRRDRCAGCGCRRRAVLSAAGSERVPGGPAAWRRPPFRPGSDGRWRSPSGSRSSWVPRRPASPLLILRRSSHVARGPIHEYRNLVLEVRPTSVGASAPAIEPGLGAVN